MGKLTKTTSKIDPSKILNEDNIKDIFNFAVERLVAMIENQKQRSQSSGILEQALKMDLEEKKEAIELIGTAIEDMTKSSRELKREIEGKEILEIAENDEEDHSSHKNSTILSHFGKKSNTDDDKD